MWSSFLLRVPPSHSGSRSPLVDNVPMLSAVLRGTSSIDTIHILSLYGVKFFVKVPAIAASLLPLCETFGSIKPTSHSTGDECSSTSTYMAFSLAFLFLIRLWKFCRPPLDPLCITELGVAAGLLEVWNKLKSNPSLSDSASVKPVYIDSFPKLRALYCQHKSCVASALSGISTGNSIHQTANMIYQKITKAGNSSSLRNLVDFLPASLAAIIDYFSSEVTRGVWKLVPMNGTDWPSPAAFIQSIESEMKAILTHVGVEVPNRSSGGAPVMLPLPMAALVSLSITFKLDKSQEYMHAITGAALENCASGCPWPSMPVIGSLWAQKGRHWHNFIVVSGSRSVFKHSNECVAQLLRSCFTSFLGTLCVSTECNVNGLLGSTISAPGPCPFVAPGFLFLRSCRNIHNVRYVNI
uniref:Mediator of RNA polymerase II transcription subunit 33A n=2 Tax=Glycine subgen. Soja TaxID=1462606 RepID=A0A0R0IJT3_SOYBN